ncbi:MAG: GntR family transcriptional regulator [Erythrobacter sp.]|uniref:GntR family transcriptional regulator n=1 Tax=Erythrobacter sp. TaxID=1042 RepID=UPI002625DDC5|nr:GntR family transcriptional regulator [Erythrobacter sp.]MDJ0979663.1 GntR family transcriptional regulator [Erythrobacter sp.]
MSTASDTAYEKIRQHLLEGRVRPGDRLTEEQLSAIAGVSRTPVREAVSRLERELLLMRTQSNRIVVPDWGEDEIDELFTLRQMLESHAAERAATRVSAQDIDELARINSELHEAVALDPPDVARFLDANRLFHEAVTEAAHSPRLGRILATLVEQPVVLHTAREYSIEDLRQSSRDHDELIAAFRARDPHWARAIMGSHLRRAFHVFADAMGEQRSSAEGACAAE